jgi:acyl homoserine lactone synthase
MHIVTVRGGALSPPLISDLFRYRHRVFVRELGWELAGASVRRDHESDQFDTVHTVYVVARNPDGDVCGCARLLPTTSPYLLHSVFPYLVASGELPRATDVWELSRFAARGCRSWPPGDLHAARLLFAHGLLGASERGAVRVVGVMSRAMQRICRRIGARLVPLGPARDVGGESIVACAIDLAGEGALLELARSHRNPNLPAHKEPSDDRHRDSHRSRAPHAAPFALPARAGDARDHARCR